jgi:hypothetical protein
MAIGTRSAKPKLNFAKETFAIAGLIDNRDGSMSKIPGIGDLPISGIRTEVSRRRIPVLVLITPSFVTACPGQPQPQIPVPEGFLGPGHAGRPGRASLRSWVQGESMTGRRRDIEGNSLLGQGG